MNISSITFRTLFIDLYHPFLKKHIPENYMHHRLNISVPSVAIVIESQEPIVVTGHTIH